MANKKSRNSRAQRRRDTAKGKPRSGGRKTKRKITEKRWWGPVWLENLVYAAIIVIAGVFIYQRTINYDLVYCDDNIFVIDYLQYNKNPDNIINSFKKSIGASYYRPVLASSFIIDYQIGEQNPSTYRTTNVILHLLGSVLVFFVLVKLRYPRLGALIFGLIFVAHPVLTPAAAWISGRNDSLITVFIASSFLALLGFYRSQTSGKWLFYILHMLLFAIALFTKETAAFLPFVILAYIIFFKRDKLITSKSISLVAGWGVLGLIWLVMRQQALQHLGESPDTIGLTALWRNLPSVPAMMGKVFLPWKMHALANFEQFSIITGLVAIAAIIAFVFLKKNVDRKKVLFGFLWYLILILPTLLIRIVYVDDFFDYAEHRMYLLMIGIFIIMLEILKAYKINFKNPIVLAVSFIIIAALGYRSFIYQPVFENRKTYWQNAIDVYPYKSRGYLDLGKAYYVNGELDTADSLYHKGIELNPDNFNLYIDLSALYIRQGKYNKAERYVKRGLKLDPDNPLANYNLGKIYLFKNKFKKARQHLEIACSRNNKYALWFVDLGVAYYRTGDFKKSVNAYMQAVRMDPGIYMAYTNMGSAYMQLKEYENAEKAFMRAMQMNPKEYNAYNNLISLYLKTKRFKDAMNVAARLEQQGGKVKPGLRRLLDRVKKKMQK